MIWNNCCSKLKQIWVVGGKRHISMIIRFVIVCEPVCGWVRVRVEALCSSCHTVFWYSDSVSIATIETACDNHRFSKK